MLRLQNRLLCALRAASHLPATSIHRLLSTATGQFVAEDYLVAACGLSPAQAVRASKRLPSLKSRSKPDAVLTFLHSIGVAKADVAAALASEPRILCSSVDKTLTPKVAQLRDIGLSPPQISRLVALAPGILGCPIRISRLPFYISFFGSFDQAIAALKHNRYILGTDVENVVRPNMTFLEQQCGLGASGFAKLFKLRGASKLLSMKSERLKETIARAEKLGIHRCSGVFKRALLIVSIFSPERVSAKMDSLKMALGCSEAELAVCKSPIVLSISEDRVGRTVEFLRVEVGLEPGYIAQRAAILTYSLKRRLMPRHYVIKVLNEKGLLKKDIDFYTVVSTAEKAFNRRFIDHNNECVPGLADAYAAGCAGKMLPEPSCET